MNQPVPTRSTSRHLWLVMIGAAARLAAWGVGGAQRAACLTGLKRRASHDDALPG